MYFIAQGPVGFEPIS